MLRSLPLSQVRLKDGFWSKWQEVMATRGIPHQLRECEKTGRLENLRRAARRESGGFSGYRFNDSDIYKVLEASAYATTLGYGEALGPWVSEAIDLVCAAQEPDGYINSFVQLDHPDMKWRSLNALHEMYCMGHLVEAGVAHFEATGKTRLLDASRRAMDCVMRAFGPNGRLGYPDHQESELALVRLARATGDAKYLDYAKWQVQARGSRPSPFEAELEDQEVVALTPGVKPLYVKDGVYDGAYAQDDLPLVTQTKPVGHAVRAMYYYCGAVDALGEDTPTMTALHRIWDELVSRRMYVTGGIGSSGRNEGFTDDYDLPNQDAYAETCAGIGLVFWAWRMFLHSADATFIDVMERALCNAVLSGVSLDCDRYFYDNPLESDGRHVRAPWFACACCPPNIARLIMSLGQYCVASGDGSLVIALPVAGTYRTEFAEIEIEGDYPWGGFGEVLVRKTEGLKSVSLRVPEWAENAEFWINGQAASVEPAPGLVRFERDWLTGDTLRFSFQTEPRWLRAHPSVLSCAGRVALQRGPFIYCLEEKDLAAAPHLWSADLAAEVQTVEGDHDRCRVLLAVNGFLDRVDQSELYSTNAEKRTEEREARFVPYFTWANRGPNAMQVWVRQRS